MASAYTQLTCREGVTWNAVADCFSRPDPTPGKAELPTYQLLAHPTVLTSCQSRCLWTPMAASPAIKHVELQQHSSALCRWTR